METIRWIHIGIILIIALFWDIQSRKIPNWLTYYGMISGIILNGIESDGGIMVGLMGIAYAFVIYYIQYLIVNLGAGDAKLMMAVGAHCGPEFIIISTIVIAIVTAITSMVILIKKGILIKTLKFSGQYIWYLIQKLLLLGKLEKEQPQIQEATTIPYGAIIVPSVIITYTFLIMSSAR